jgi:hypothetical protein
VTRARALVACAAAALALASTAGDAWARSNFGVQVNLSLIEPLSTYVDSATLLQPTQLELGEVDLPYIADISGGTGLGIGLMLLFREIEVVLSIQFMPWKQAILRYEGDRAAVSSSPTQVNDAGVTYRALDPPQGAAPPEYLGDGLALTVIGGGYRVYLAEGFFEPYLPFGGGLALAQLSPSITSRVGVQLWGGAGVDFVIENLTFALDMRYHYTMTNHAFGIQQGADNARVTGEDVLSTLTSDLHMLSINVGARYSFD